MKKMKFVNFVKGNRKSEKSNKSFYIALAVCILAVGAATWSTYSSVMNYMNPKPKSTALTSAADTPADRVISGISGYKNNTSSSILPQSSSQSDASSLSSEDSDSASSPESTVETSVTQTQVDEVKETSNDEAIETGNTPDYNPEYSGALVYPVGKNILKHYSAENPVYSKTFNDWRAHLGIDFAADKGDPVKAMTGGVVKEIYNDDLLGVTVVIEHNGGFVGYYSGLGETIMIKPGEGVGAGDIIGAVKEVPSELLDDSHLHLEIKVGDKLVDPLEFLEKRN